MIISDQSPCDDGEDSEYDTEHDSRKRIVASKDIVHCFSLKDYFQQKITDWGVGVGQPFYTNVISNIDCETLGSLKEYISL